MRIGMCLPIAQRGDPATTVRYEEIRRLALLAEDGGLDSIWVADHLFHQPPNGPFRGFWESLTVLAGLAEATNRVELGPLVLCVPFRNPGVIAWQASALDEISGGRFVLGLGCGWHAPEFEAFGFEFDRRVSVLADSLAVIVPLLREGNVDFEGERAVGHAKLAPRGPRPKGPPIMIASFGPRMQALTAQWADRWNTVWYGRPNDKFDEDRRNLEQACANRGRDIAEIEISAGLAICDDEYAARRTDTNFLTGSPAQVADAFAEWEAKGVTEIMCRLEPSSMANAELVVRAAEEFRRR